MTESTAIVRKTAGGDLAVQEFTDQQIRVLKAALMPQANDAELAVFIEYARRTGLDPFSRQIYAIPKKTQNGAHAGYEFMTGIDGLRLIAERSGEYEGSEVEWSGPDGKWTDVWLDDSKAPSAARVTIFRSGRPPRKTVVRWKEFCRVDRQGHPMGAWKSHPAHQLGIAAERHALRRAFPRETAGIYVDIDGEGGGPTIREPDAPASRMQIGRLHALAHEAGWTDDERHQRAGVESFKDLTKGQASLLIDAWTKDIEGDIVEGEVVEDAAAAELPGDAAAGPGAADASKPKDRSRGKGTRSSGTKRTAHPGRDQATPDTEPPAQDDRTEVDRTAPASGDAMKEPPDHGYVGDGEGPCQADFEGIACGYALESPIHRGQAALS